MDRDAAAQAIDAFLRAVGRDSRRESELSGRGERAARAYAEDLSKGHGMDVDAVLSHDVFAGRTELVVVGGPPVVATCLAGGGLEEAAVYSALRAER